MGTCRGGSNEYPQSMFWIKNKKNRYTPENLRSFFFYIYKSAFKGVYVSRTGFPDEDLYKYSANPNIIPIFQFNLSLI